MTAVASATPTSPPADHVCPRWGAGRITLIVVGALLALLGVSILVGGVAVAVVDNTRDPDGFLMSAPGQVTSDASAILMPDLQVHGFGGWGVDAQSMSGTMRITTTSDRPVFVGIGPSDQVAAYLASVRHDVVEDFSTSPFRVSYRAVAGGAPSVSPAAQSFWVATGTGTGTNVLTWSPQEGDWSVVMLNADGSPQIDAMVSVGALVPVLHGVAVGLCLGGSVLFLLGLALVLIAVVSYERQPRRRPQPRITVSAPTS
jgi:hypothetical protein